MPEPRFLYKVGDDPTNSGLVLLATRGWPLKLMLAKAWYHHWKGGLGFTEVESASIVLFCADRSTLHIRHFHISFLLLTIITV